MGWIAILHTSNYLSHHFLRWLPTQVLASHPEVSECAVFGVKDALKGRLPFGFIVLNKHLDDKPEEYARIEKECVALVRKEIGPVAAFKLCKTVFRLPKTRSVSVDADV